MFYSSYVHVVWARPYLYVGTSVLLHYIITLLYNSKIRPNLPTRRLTTVLTHNATFTIILRACIPGVNASAAFVNIYTLEKKKKKVSLRGSLNPVKALRTIQIEIYVFTARKPFREIFVLWGTRGFLFFSVSLSLQSFVCDSNVP